MIRAAVEGDQDGIAAVATAHDIAGYDSVHNPRYQALLRDHGRLVVAEADGSIVGFGGMILAGGAAMVTDLFVLQHLHGRGLGTAMTNALLDGHARRMTFSSRSALARSTYARAGMSPQWFLRLLRGTVPDTVPMGGALRAVEVDHDVVQSDRPELVRFFETARCFHIADEERVRGHALVRETDDSVAVDRLVTDGAHDAAIAAVLRALPVGATVQACIPEPSAADAFLRGIGFAEVYHDLHMASETGLIPAGAVVLNPGLA